MKSQEHSLELQYNSTENFILIRKKGTLIIDNVKYALTYIERAYCSKKPDRIWDLSQADLTNADDNAVRYVVGYVMSFSNLKNRRVALVASRKMSLIILEMYKTYAKEIKANIGVFDSVAFAKKWLKEGVKEKPIHKMMWCG